MPSTILAEKLPSFPDSERDWTISLSESIPLGPLLTFINGLSSPLLEKTLLLDLYKSEKIGKDRKNATFRFTYRDSQKTVEYEEVEKEHQRLTQLIEEKLANRVPFA